jgi:hypothetical protein
MGTADLKRIQAVLEQEVVQRRLSDLGLTRDEILTRLQLLSPRQLHQLAAHLDELQLGGDSALGILITLGAITVLVVVFLQLAGYKVVLR